MKADLMNVRSIIMGLAVLMVLYLAVNMIMNAGVQHVQPKSNNNPDPAIHLGVAII